MRVIDASQTAILNIGYAGEKDRTQVKFPIADIQEEFPGGNVVIHVRRPGEGTKHDILPDVIGTEVYWTVGDYDLALRGQGECQLIYSTADHIAKRKVWKTLIDRSIEGSNESIPPTWEDIEADLLAAAGAVAEAVASYDEMTAEASALEPGSEPTAEIDHTGDHPVLKLGLVSGEKGDPGEPGQDGHPGAEGFSPVATVTKSGKTATISITDKNGTTTATVTDGEDADPTTIIDDNAGEGDRTKVWSADKSASEVSSLNNALNEKQDAPETAGTAGQVLGLNSNLDPVWVNQSGGGGGVDPDTIAPTEASTTATSAHAVGELFFLNGSLLVALSAIAIGDTITTTGNSPNAAVTMLSSELIRDIQVNGTSVVNQGVANIPIASANDYGAVKVPSGANSGLTIYNGGLVVYSATQGTIKQGSNDFEPLVPNQTHSTAFYGLARAAGDLTQKNSSNTLGTYTEDAKSKISDMLNAPETVSGSTPSITAKPGVRYICGECATLTIVVPATGDVEVIFESGSTATVLTVTPPSGITAVNWANGFDPTSLDANTRYDLIITDGEWGLAASWAV